MNTSQRIRNLTISALLCALLCISAFIRIPLPLFPVPFTLQVMIIFVCASILSPKYCALTIGTYIAIGLTGLPVFSAGGGISYVLTPYFGYLLGFLGAGILMSAIYGSRIISNRLVAYVLGTIVGILVIYVIGVGYMYLMLNVYMDVPMLLSDAIYKGALVFLTIDALKAIIAYIIITPIEKATGRTRRPA